MSDVTDDDLQRWERLCEAAGRYGPVSLKYVGDSYVAVVECDKYDGLYLIPVAEMFAESPTAIPRLIAAYREALAEIERLRSGRDDSYVSPPLPIVRTVKCRITNIGPLPTPPYRDDDDDFGGIPEDVF